MSATARPSEGPTRIKMIDVKCNQELMASSLSGHLRLFVLLFAFAVPSMQKCFSSE